VNAAHADLNRNGQKISTVKQSKNAELYHAASKTVVGHQETEGVTDLRFVLPDDVKEALVYCPAVLLRGASFVAPPSGSQNHDPVDPRSLF
jgi:hypothetical protein